MLWVLGFVLSFCGLFIWLEFGTMFPRSGGEKVYLEAIYTKPKYLATVVFASNAILLGFTASGCIVSVDWLYVWAYFSWCVGLCEQVSDINILRRESLIIVLAFLFQRARLQRIGPNAVSLLEVYFTHSFLYMRSLIQRSSLVIFFVTLLHGLAPRTGVYIMNVRIYPPFRSPYSF